MKYIIIPLIKIILVILFYLIMYPFIIACCLLSALWNFNFNDLKELLDTENFGGEDIICKRPGDQYYVYKTAIDWILSRKTYKIYTSK